MGKRHFCPLCFEDITEKDNKWECIEEEIKNEKEMGINNSTEFTRRLQSK